MEKNEVSDNSFQYINTTEIEKGKCDVCRIDVHRASHAEHLRSKKHLENKRKIDIIITNWLFREEQGPIEAKNKKKYIILEH